MDSSPLRFPKASLWAITLGTVTMGLCLLPEPALSQPANDHSNALSTGPNASGEFAGLQQAAAANLFTGDATLSVPIQLPPGRGAAAPALSLSYSSSGGDGPFGLGWNMALGSIVRSTRNGAPTCVEDHEFTLSIPGATVELVYDSSDSLYYAKVDEAYIEATANETNNEWTVHDRAGRSYRFGTTPEARAWKWTDVFMDEASCDFTALWALTQIEDPNGNTIDFIYANFGNFPYIAEIRYGGSAGGLAHPFRVTFQLRDPPRAYPQLSYQLGVYIEFAQLIDQIQVEYKPDVSSLYATDRTYTLVYDETPYGGHARLEQIDATGLPSRTFRYVDSEVELVQTDTVANPLADDSLQITRGYSSNTIFRTEHLVLDMNGDGIADAVQINGSAWEVYLGTPTGFSAQPMAWDISELPVANALRETWREVGSDTFDNTQIDTIDVTGDGIPDWVDARATPWKVYPGYCTSETTCGFSTEVSWTAPFPYVGVLKFYERGSATQRALIDMNGDGFADLVNAAFDAQDQGLPWPVYLGTPSGFALTPITFSEPGGILSAARGHIAVSREYYTQEGTTSPLLVTTKRLFDFNGDGLPDVVWVIDDYYMGLWGYPISPFRVTQDGYWVYCEVVSCFQSTRPTNMLIVQLNTGSDFFSPAYGSALGTVLPSSLGGFFRGYITFQISKPGSTLASPNDVCHGETCYEYVIDDFIDVNGDGLPDYVQAPWGDTGSHRVMLNVGGGVLEQGPGALQYNPGSGGFMEIQRVIPDVPAGRALRERYTVPGGQKLTRSTADVLDLNGDGLGEFVKVHPVSGDWNAGVIAHPLTELDRIQPIGRLLEADDGAGGLTAFRYAPSTSTQFDHGGQDGAPDLPVVRWVTTAIRQTDGLGCTPTTDPFDPNNECLLAGHERLRRYHYEGGLFDVASREFRGFGMVKEIDSNGNEVETVFSQADYTRGKVLSETVRAVGSGGASYDLRIVTNQWEAVESIQHEDRTQVYLAETSTRTLSVPENPAEDMCFVSRNDPPDEFGRVRRSCTYACGTEPAGLGCGGQLVAGELFSITNWSIPTAGSYVRERPYEVLSLYVKPDSAPKILAYKKMRYDGTAGQDPLGFGTVTKGNVRWVESWLDQSVTNPAGWLPPLRMEYDAYGNLIETTNERGHTWTSEFEPSLFALYPVRQIAPSVGGVAPETETVTSLRFGKPTSITDENGQISEFAYDALGRLICEALPGDSVAGCHGSGFPATREFYYAFANPNAASFEGKHHSVETRVVNEDSPTGYNKTITYADALGRERFRKVERTIGTANPLAAPSLVIEGQRDFDSEGRPVREYVPYLGPAALENPAGASIAATVMSYQLNLISLTDPLGRVQSVDPPDSQLVVWTYRGRITESQDQSGAEVVTTRDHLGRTIVEEQRDSGQLVLRITYTLDGAGRVLTREVANDPTTRVTFAYDTLGRGISRTDPNSSGSWQFGYDEVGNLVYVNDPKTLQHVQSVYDALNRLVRRCTYGSDAFDATTSAASCGTGDDESSYLYDDASSNGIGRLRTATDAHGFERFWYDERGRVEKRERTIDGISADTSFVYDRAGRLETITYPDADAVQYGYNAAGQLISIDVAIDDVDYDFLGRRTTMVRSNGSKDTWSYHGSSENFRLRDLRSFRTDLPSVTYLDLTYAYNNIGKVRSITDHRNAVPDPLSNTADYNYDGIGRLDDVTNSSFNDDFGFDELGNLNVKNGMTLEYPVTTGPHQVGMFGAATITYTENGNRSQKSEPSVEVETYTYNRLDQLTRIDVDADQVTFGYDYAGRRIWRRTNGADEIRYFSKFAESQQGGVLTKHLWAGDLLIASSHENEPEFSSLWTPFYIPLELLTVFAWLVAALLLGAGVQARPLRSRIPHGALAARAVGAALLMLATGPAMLLFPSPAAAGGGGNPGIPYSGMRHYHADHLGSVQVVSGGSAGIWEQIRYDAYGAVRARKRGNGDDVPGSDHARREFTGYEAEHLSGLSYAGARFYDAELGQFLTHDPADQFPSPYAYGPGDPMNGTDPTGRFFWEIALFFGLWLASISAYKGFREGVGEGFKALGISLAAFAVGYGIGIAGSAVGVGGLLKTAASIAASPMIQETIAAASIGLGLSSLALGDSAPAGLATASQALAIASLAAAGLSLGLAFGASSSSTANGVAPSQGASGDSTLVQLDYYPLQASPAAGAAGATHATATVLNPDPNGPDFFVEGGADGVPGGSASASGAVGAVSGSGSLGNVNAIGQFGRTPENLARTAVASETVRVPLSFAKAVHGAQQYVNAVNAAGVPYNPFGPNSNTVAHSLIPYLGGVRPRPAAWAPGSREAFPFP